MKERKAMTQECGHAHECVQEKGGMTESEKKKESETVCPEDSILEREDVRVVEAEGGGLESRVESSSVLPR